MARIGDIFEPVLAVFSRGFGRMLGREVDTGEAGLLLCLLVFGVVAAVVAWRRIRRPSTDRKRPSKLAVALSSGLFALTAILWASGARGAELMEGTR